MPRWGFRRCSATSSKPGGKNKEKFEGVDFIEAAELSVDMSDEEFGKLVAFLKEHDLGVGDIVACTWPAPDTEQGPAAYGPQSASHPAST